MEYTDSLLEKYETQDEKEKKKKDKKLADKRWATVSIASIPLVMTLGNSMLIPVLPTMEKELNISPFQSSLIITVYSIVAIFFIPIAGYLSDKIGRKKVIIPSLIFAAIGGGISAFTAWKVEDGYWLILIGRILQGIGAAGAFPIVLPLVGDMFRTKKERTTSLGLIETSNTLGKGLSPILGAYLASILWFLPFISIPIFCLVSILMMLFLVKEPVTEKVPPFRQFLKNTMKIYKLNNTWLNAVFFIGGLLMFLLFGVLFYLSSMLETKYEIDGIKKGFILAIPLAALCLSSFITGKKLKDNEVIMKKVTLVGLILISVGILLIIFFDSLWVQIGLFVLAGIGIGLSLPPLDALITEGIEEESRGTISSFYSSMRFIGVALGPPILAILMDRAENLIFYILAGLSVSCVIACLIGIRPEKDPTL